MNKYDVDPSRLKGQKNIIDYILSIMDRLEKGEKGLRIGFTAIEDGNLTVRNGDIIVSETDDSIVLKILHGAVPEIRFWPLGDTDTHQATLFAYDYNGDVTNPDQAIQLDVELVDNTVDGGKVLLTRNYAILSHQPDGFEESYIWLNAQGSSNRQVFLFRGKWSNQQQVDSNMGLYMGSIGVSAGFSSWTHTYSVAFASTMCPVVGLVNTAGTVTWNITAMSTSAFTVTWTGTLAKTLNFWNFRI